MAERRTARKTRGEDEPAQDNGELNGDGEDTESRSRSSGRPGRDPGLTAPEAAQRGLSQIAELTGTQPEGVTGVEAAEDGWVVGVEVGEDRRDAAAPRNRGPYGTELD